jgi:hypothetical protein
MLEEVMDTDWQRAEMPDWDVEDAVSYLLIHKGDKMKCQIDTELFCTLSFLGWFFPLDSLNTL